MKNFDNFTYFIYVGNNPNYSFRNYVDPTTGMERGYVVGYEKNGNPIYKEWFFNYSHKRRIRVGAHEVDKTGQTAIDFLKSSPEFYGNPDGLFVNGQQALYMFREINEEKDAKDAVDARMKVVAAEQVAYKLKGQELRDMAAVIGVFSPSESFLMMKVGDFASNYPEKFMLLHKDDSLKVRALIKKAINDQVFKLEGRQIKWEGRTIGADEDEAVTALLKDENLLKAVKLNIEKFGSEK